MKRFYFLLALAFFGFAPVRAQDSVIVPSDNLVVDGVPKIPASLAETAGRYASYRSASLADWQPTRREMLIATRFAETPQLHLVKTPGGARQQLTFFADSVGSGRFHPIRPTKSSLSATTICSPPSRTMRSSKAATSSPATT